MLVLRGLLNIMHEFVMLITIKVLKLCVFELIGKFIINNCLSLKYPDIKELY